MSLGFSFLYAKKIFFSRTLNGTEKTAGQRSLAGAVLCIALSLIPLVVVLCVSNGMIAGITGRIIHLSSRDIQVTADGNSLWTAGSEIFCEYAQELEKIDGVVKVFPEVQGMGLASGKNMRCGAFYRAVQNNLFETNSWFKKYFQIIEGTADLSQKRNAIIGEKLAQNLSVHAGDKIRLITVKSSGEKIVPKVSVFNVAGIVSSGYQELDALWFFIPLESGFDAVAKSSSSYVVGIETEDSFGENLKEILHDVRTHLLSNDVYGKTLVADWKQVNASQFENFASTKALLIVIMLAIIIVASINISSAIIMVVMERKREVVILRSTGASHGEISSAFVITGFLAGLSGTVIGISAGLVLSFFMNQLIRVIECVLNFFYGLLSFGLDSAALEKIKLLDPAFYLQEIPIVIPTGEVILIFFVSVFLSVIMSLVPSLKTGKKIVVKDI